MSLLAVIIGALWLFYKYWVSAYNYWQKRNVPFYPPSFPFGSDSDLVFLKKFRGYSTTKMYNHCAPHPMFGIYIMRKPHIVVRDPELIRLILAKEFTHFMDRTIIDISEKDVISQHLFILKGEKWRALRIKLTPTFTSGRIKSMFPLFVSCAEILNSLLVSKLNCEVDIKDLTGRFTADIICTCAFGLDLNVINNPDHKLRKIGVESMRFRPLFLISVALLRAAPWMSRLFHARFNSIDTERYLLNLVGNTIEQREKSGIRRNDFLDILIELKNKGTIGEDQIDHPFEMTLELIAAQCFVFFVAGFETASSVQSFCLYELAINPDIQKRLIEEIDATLEKHGGITYQAVQDMQYLDMVLSETLRKYPTLPTLVRDCTKSFTTPDDHVLEKGIGVIIPVWSLHHDPDYFPEPEKFDPERFSPENRDSIVPFTYLPFGEGPRTCIGMRFGQLQSKVGIITILRKFQVVPSEKTEIPLQLGGGVAISTKKPIVLKLVSRMSK